MNETGVGKWMAKWCVRAVLFTLVIAPLPLRAVTEQTFDVLKIGSRTYRNVTVTTKAKNYIFILHSAGMQNISLSELPPDLREKLGYVDPHAPRTNHATAWAKQTFARLDDPKVKGVEQQLARQWHERMAAAHVRLPPFTWGLLLGILGLLLMLHLFQSYCCLLICRKAGTDPGVLVWLPILQVFPMLRAAKMSPWWFLALLVPVLNLVAHILWCVNIVSARGKNGLLALLLVVPLTNFFAFLYLAFSEAAAPEKEERKVEIMTLETA